MSFTTKSKINYSELTSIASDKNYKKDNCKKSIKDEQQNLDESISSENSNTIKKNKGMNFR